MIIILCPEASMLAGTISGRNVSVVPVTVKSIPLRNTNGLDDDVICKIPAFAGMVNDESTPFNCDERS